MIERAAVDVKTFHAATRAATTPRYPCFRQGQDRYGAYLTYVRDELPFGSNTPPAAVFYYSRDRGAAS